MSLEGNNKIRNYDLEPCPFHIGYPLGHNPQCARAKEAAVVFRNVQEESKRYSPKYDAGKPRWELLPMSAVEDLVAVLTYGAEKYSAEGWRTVENAEARYFAAAMRHIAAYRRGERIDPESKLPHLVHAMCCVTFLVELTADRNQPSGPG